MRAVQLQIGKGHEDIKNNIKSIISTLHQLHVYSLHINNVIHAVAQNLK